MDIDLNLKPVITEEQLEEDIRQLYKSGFNREEVFRHTRQFRII